MVNITVNVADPVNEQADSAVCLTNRGMITFSNSSLEIINLTSIQIQLNERVKHFGEVKNG